MSKRYFGSCRHGPNVFLEAPSAGMCNNAKKYAENGNFFAKICHFFTKNGPIFVKKSILSSKNSISWFARVLAVEKFAKSWFSKMLGCSCRYIFGSFLWEVYFSQMWPWSLEDLILKIILGCHLIKFVNAESKTLPILFLWNQPSSLWLALVALSCLPNPLSAVQRWKWIKQLDPLNMSPYKLRA